MGKLLIHQYLNDLERLKSASGSVREGVVSEAFKDLLKAGARQHDLIFVAQHKLETTAKERRYVDGALLYSLRVPFGYWEAKDEKDDLDAEIDLKFRRGYESVPTFPVKRVDILDDKARKAGLAPKAILKADKASSRIILDSETTLSGVPTAAWDYMLGNRSALEWVLDQYKEKKPKDPTIREKFNTYRFADYKEKVVDLLMRVTTVSVETMQIVNEMRAARR
ncbi:MAG: type ISP restriction/modification enzyme [Steroidobacteraceae bacterium]|nr:hypothetical protein [Steroidobacteraceae bacterium]MBP7014141.1 hypothetical protein [Steroidobacteraceae bacterium]